MRITPIEFNGIPLSYQYATAGEQGRTFPIINGKAAFDVVALIVKGTVSRTIADTGEKLEDRGAGWFSLENQSGFGPDKNCSVQTSYPTDSEIIFFQMAGNEAAAANLTLIRMKTGEELLLDSKNSYFLVKGEIQNGDQALTGPVEMPTVNADYTIKAVYDCYIWNFAPIAK